MTVRYGFRIITGVQSGRSFTPQLGHSGTFSNSKGILQDGQYLGTGTHGKYYIKFLIILFRDFLPSIKCQLDSGKC